MAKKLLLAAAILAGVLVLAIGIVYLVDFESPELGELVVGKVNEATGAELSVDRYRLNLIRGLELENVRVSASLPGGNLEAHLDGLVVKHRLLPLLFGKVVAEQIVLVRPEVELTERATARAERSSRANGDAPKREAPSSSPSGEGETLEETGSSASLALEITQIVIQDGSIRLRRRGTEENATSVTGLNLRLQDLSFHPRAISILHALSAAGELGIDTLLLDRTLVREVEGRLKLDNGTFEGQEVSFRTDQGRFRAGLEANFNQIPFGYTLSLRGDPLDVNAIAGSTGGGFGPGVLEFDAEGYGTDSKGIKGRGVLRLAEGRLPSSPALLGVEKALGRGTSLVGAPYQATEAPFHIDKNQLTLSGFRLETPQAALDLKGTVDLDGPLALSLALRTPREGLVIHEVPDEVLDALTDDEGWVTVPLQITGTQAEPRVLPDANALLAQAKQNTGKLIEEGVKSLLQRGLN
ncbi:MAG TPA: AsmA-like C-terminal region-containing protein [Vicinamibacteria bacterium]|jgi:hypothetical protein